MSNIHDKNIAYFDQIDTEEKAYFLGFLYADGSVRRPGFTIGLQKQDRHILERFSMAIYGKIHLGEKGPSLAVITIRGKPRTIRSNGAYILQVASVQMARSLNRLGMMQAKSLILGFPNADQVPDNLLRHFIRGYFDGDGCLSHRTANHAKRYIVTIISSYDFCQAFREKINKMLDVNFTWTKQPSKISAVNLSGNRQIKTFMDWIYEGATISLDRKRAKYEELLADIKRMDGKPRYSQHNNLSYDKSRNKWVASVRWDKRTIRLGRYETEQAALSAQQTFIASKTESSLYDGLPES